MNSHEPVRACGLGDMPLAGPRARADARAGGGTGAGECVGLAAEREARNTNGGKSRMSLADNPVPQMVPTQP